MCSTTALSTSYRASWTRARCFSSAALDFVEALELVRQVAGTALVLANTSTSVCAGTSSRASVPCDLARPELGRWRKLQRRGRQAAAEAGEAVSATAGLQGGETGTRLVRAGEAHGKGERGRACELRTAATNRPMSSSSGSGCKRQHWLCEADSAKHAHINGGRIWESGGGGGGK